MRFRAWRNLSDPYRAAVEGHSPWAAGARDPQPIVSGDVATDPAMASYLPLFQSEQIGALGFIPLVGGGRLIGKFMVYYARPRELTRAGAGAGARHRQPCRRRRAPVSLARRAAADRPLQRDVRRHSRPRSAQSAGRHHHLGAPGDEPRRERPAAEAARPHPLQQRSDDAHDRSAARLHARAPGRRHPAGADRARSRPAGPPGHRRARRGEPRLDAPLDQPGRYARDTGIRTGCRSCSRTWWPTPFSMASPRAAWRSPSTDAPPTSVRVAVHNMGVIPADQLSDAVRAAGRAANGEVARSRAGPLHHPRVGPRPRRTRSTSVRTNRRNDVHRGAPAPAPKRRRSRPDVGERAPERDAARGPAPAPRPCRRGRRHRRKKSRPVI